MARPSDQLNLVMVDIGRSLEIIAKAVKGASALDATALDYAVKAYAMIGQWRRDHRDTSRRHAFGSASAALALASLPPLGKPTEPQQLARRALALYAGALQQAIEGNAIGAANAARHAATMAQPVADHMAFAS